MERHLKIRKHLLGLEATAKVTIILIKLKAAIMEFQMESPSQDSIQKQISLKPQEELEAV
jgi:hypothetical protein